MEVYESLPRPILSKFGQEIPLHVQQRLHYQWKLTHRFAKSVLAISHMASRKFVRLCMEFGVDLPEHLSCRLCPWCSVIQLPTITCYSRLRKRSNRSKGNIKANKKMKNEVVIRCMQCDRISSKEPGVNRGPKNQDNTKITSSKVCASNTKVVGVVCHGQTRTKTSSFSFKDSMKQQDGNRKYQEQNRNSDFIAFSTPSSRDSIKRSNNSTVDLLEMEAMNKKKKRKSMSKSPSISSPPISNSSLGSLQKMLQNK